MSRASTVSRLDCVRLLYKGYILENEHGYSVRLLNGVQVKTNPRRQKRDYKFDYKTWRVVGRISLFDRLKNSWYLL